MGAVGDGTVDLSRISFQLRCNVFGSPEDLLGDLRRGRSRLSPYSFQFRYIVGASSRGLRAADKEGADYLKTYFDSISLHLFSQLLSFSVLRRGGVPGVRRISFQFRCIVLASCHGLIGAVGGGAVNVRRIWFEFRCIVFCSCEGVFGVVGGCLMFPPYFVSISLHRLCKL